MNFQDLKAFALAPQNTGELNQLRGALKAISDLTANQEDIERDFLLPGSAVSASDVREDLYYSNFSSYDKFRKEIYRLLDKYFQTNNTVPKIFVTAYTQGLNKLAQKMSICCAGRLRNIINSRISDRC